MSDRVRIEINPQGIAEVILVRGDKMNALDAAMFDALVAALARLQSEPGLRVVVLHGEGRAFCAGLDMARFGSMASGSDASSGSGGGLGDLRTRSHGSANAAQYVGLGWRALPVPVIAAVHGVAFGGGLQLALGADLRYISATTRLCVMEIQWGLVPDMAGTVLMQGLVRDDHLRELTYSGRIVMGDEAVALGLATRVCDDPLAEARALARSLAQRSPSALRAAKRLLNQAAGHFDAAAAAQLQAESDEQMALLGQAHQVEAVRAQVEKRPPSFDD
ncbi:MAG: hypothetical protein RIQ60_568 [Pseudomonadota bacterium]|jgi:enoyl-CoA hydratase/carnithine racemase